MATEPRKISTMVERAMGAGGQMMPEEDSLQIELPVPRSNYLMV